MPTDPYDLPDAHLGDVASFESLRPGTRWTLEATALYPPYRPPRIVAGYAPRERLSAARIAQPESWILESPTVDSVGISLLADARVFPGRIRRRMPKHHEWGQMLLTANGERLPASLSTIGGNGTLPVSVDLDAPSERLDGTHFFLGSLHPHFGHFLVEGLARVWAWRRVADLHPDARLLVYEPGLPRFGTRLLELAGVETDRLLFLQNTVEVDRLYVPDVAMRTHRWVSNPMGETWQHMASRIDDGPAVTPTRRVFLSRRSVANRPLVNTDEIEGLFESHGFEIIAPETLDVIEQIRLARSSSTLAGCVGSQMYLAAFQHRAARNLVLAPSNFYLRDDSLLADALDHDLAVCFGTAADFSTQERAWSIDHRIVEQGIRAVAD
ncbi:MAG: glycosyltransferase family 61 protein [Actinomycetota bacterium]